MSGDFAPPERAMLDRLTVPAMRDTLAADIVSKAIASAPAVPPRRGPRNGWRRHGVVLMSAGALLVASAAAAASGMLDRLPASIPGLATVIAAVSPHATPAKPKPVRLAHRAAPKRMVPGAAPSPAATDLPPVPPLLAGPAQPFQDARIAAGLPALRPGARAVVRERIRERIAMMPPARRARVRERFAHMTPEQRAQAQVRFLANHPRLAARLQARQPEVGLTVPPAEAGPVAPVDETVRANRAEQFRERRA